MHTSMSPSGKYVPNGTEPNAETTMVFFFSFTPSPSNSFSKHSRINDSIFRNTIRRLFSDCFDGRSEAINSSVNASNKGEEEETPRTRFFFFFSRVVVSVARNAFPLLVSSKSSFILVLLSSSPRVFVLSSSLLSSMRASSSSDRRDEIISKALSSSSSSSPPSVAIFASRVVVVLLFEEQNAFARSTNDGNRRPNMCVRCARKRSPFSPATTTLSDKKTKVGETNFQALFLSLGAFSHARE